MRRIYKQLFLLISLILGHFGGTLLKAAPRASSQKNTSSKKPAPFLLSVKKGAPLSVDFLDGRVASSFVTKLYSSQPIPLQMLQNTCVDTLATEKYECHLQYPSAKILTSLKWVKHSDSQKIGKVIQTHLKQKITYRSADENLDGYLIQENSVNFQDFFSHSSYLEQAPPLAIECKDYSWLPNSDGSEAPQNLSLVSWTREGTAANPEDQDSKVVELRSMGGALDLEFIKNEKNFLTLKSIGSFVLSDARSSVILLDPFLNESVTFVLQNSKSKEMCSISFSHDDMSPPEDEDTDTTVNKTLVDLKKELVELDSQTKNETYLFEDEKVTRYVHPYFKKLVDEFQNEYFLESRNVQ